MCDETLHAAQTPQNIGRRAILTAIPLSLLLAPRAAAIPKSSAGSLALPVGLDTQSLAMHLHGSDSEGPASWSSHLEVARSWGIDYIFPSDHDWRVEATHADFQREYNFADGLTSWMEWGRAPGSAAGSSQSIITLTGEDASHGSMALSLHQPAARAGTASGVVVTRPRDRLEGNVRGRRIAGEVKISGGVFALTVTLSRHGDKQLELTYRCGDVVAGDNTSHGYHRIVNVPTPTGEWASFDVSPVDDIARLWPAIEAEDNSFLLLELSVESIGGAVDVLIPRLELPRLVVGQDAIDHRSAMLDRLRSTTALQIGHALEYSWPAGTAHMNGWFADAAAPMLSSVAAARGGKAYDANLASMIKAQGGVVSLNHPAGVSTKIGTAAEQSTKARDTARRLIANGVYGAEVVEIGYAKRGSLGVDSYLLQMAAMVWRDGWFFTANAVSDDHGGKESGWGVNPGITHTWAPSADLSAQLTALRAGAAHVTMHTAYRGQLWLSLDGAPMGSVALNPDRSGQGELSLVATELPAAGSLTLYAGAIDHPGATVTSPNLMQIARWSGVDLGTGPVSVRRSRGPASFYLAVARNASGSIVGFTNPVWDLAAERATRPIPMDRRVR